MFFCLHFEKNDSPFVLPLYLFFILLFSISGCSVHDSEVEKASIKMPLHYIEVANDNATALRDKLWWESFKDPVLDRLISKALEGNLDISSAILRLDQSRAVYRQVNAARFPTLGFQGEAARSHSPSFSEEVTGGSYELQLQAGYEVDLWQKYKRASDAAEFDVNASMEEVKGLYLSVAAQVADLYFIAVEQRAQIDMVDDIVRSARDTLAFVERRYRGGMVDAVDVYQARQTLNSAEARLPVYYTLLRQTEHAISVLCGEFPERGVTGDMDELTQDLILPDTGVPAVLLRRRPEIRKAFLTLQAQDARVASAVADLYPAFRIGGSFGQSQSMMTSSPVVGEFWSIFAGLTQPIFEGGRRVAEVDRSQAVFREAVINYRQKVLNAVMEVEDAVAACRGGEERIKRLEKWVDAASNSLQLSKNRYFWGITEYLPVLTAEAAQLEAKSQLISARRIYISNFISLAKALGGGWMDKRFRDLQGHSSLESSEELSEEPLVP